MLRSIGWIAASLLGYLSAGHVGLASVSGSKRAGRRELFQNDFLSAHKLRRGVIRCRMQPMKACQKGLKLFFGAVR